jgi:secretion/DNA translocation related TadE-like protein
VTPDIARRHLAAAGGPSGHARRVHRAARSDRGAASVWVLAVALCVVVVALALAAAGTVRVARHQARTAADLGALAGAVRAVEGEGPACGRAAEFVAANGGRLVGCRLEGLDVVVSVEVPVTPVPGTSRVAAAASRVGPIRSTA